MRAIVVLAPVLLLVASLSSASAQETGGSFGGGDWGGGSRHDSFHHDSFDHDSFHHDSFHHDSFDHDSFGDDLFRHDTPGHDAVGEGSFGGTGGSGPADTGRYDPGGPSYTDADIYRSPAYRLAMGGGILLAVSFVFLAVVRGAIASRREARRVAEEDRAFLESWNAGTRVDVSAISLAIDWRQRKGVQAHLTRLATTGKTSTTAGLTRLLHETITELRRVEGSWLYAGAVNARPAAKADATRRSRGSHRTLVPGTGVSWCAPRTGK